jgi:hypothetical protein
MEQDMKAAAPRIRTIDLGYEQMMVFDDGHGDRVRVLYGATWLTREGDGEDTVLRPGAERALGDGRTLIAALEPTRLQVVDGASQRRPLLRTLTQRMWRWARRLQFGPVAPGVAA